VFGFARGALTELAGGALGQRFGLRSGGDGGGLGGRFARGVGRSGRDLGPAGFGAHVLRGHGHARRCDQRDRLRRALDPATPRRPDARARDDAAPRPEALSIDEILEDKLWAREQERINKERGAAHGRETEPQEGPVEDMIAPDAVFAPKDGGDDP